ncbi:alginate export family protein [Adhaeribacter terreus]
MEKVSVITFILLLFSFHHIFAQQPSDTVVQKRAFIIEAEFRPRTEYRNGYRQLKPDTARPAFFTDHRSRIYLTYTTHRFLLHTSFQDVRVWGDQDPQTANGSVQIFETYAESSLSDKISVRIGRQKIIYDNERLFAQNNWRQIGRAHEAVRFMYKSEKLETDLIGAFNQEKGANERNFETDYSPDFKNYKVLAASFIKWKATDKITLITINATDGFQDDSIKREYHFRFTSGGRVTYTDINHYLTVAAYYQYGKTPLGQTVKAYYVQPEVKYQFPHNFTFKLGAEIMSGDDATKSSSVSHSFDPLYGVNHRFMGSMDYFTRFPGDLNNAGLINPYLFIFYELSKKITLRADSHLFYSQNDFVREETVIPKYLGFENDLLFIFNANKFTELHLGYSYMLPTQSMQYIKRTGNYRNWQDWAFLMITFTPELFKWESTVK